MPCLNNNIREARGEEIKGNKEYRFPHLIQGEVNIISILMLVIRGIHIQIGLFLFFNMYCRIKAKSILYESFKKKPPSSKKKTMDITK